MDISFAAAVRNASNAWAQGRTTDAVTMAELTKRQLGNQSPAQLTGQLSASQLAVLQPELARYGQLGTKLNLYA
ncbi:hypothetical protein [Comamonas sp. GB3 AK4-5]|uniref:hypothetical protein n=1 Tax=Comamonas sp. GB3 AK4-5 TaxID=3231487 RepID=UPI00351E8658